MLTAEQQRARTLLSTIIRPTLRYLALGGLAAEQLVIGTGIQESLLVYRRQKNGGPALGLFQTESATFRDLAERGLSGRSTLRDKISRLLLPWEPFEPETLALNDYFACAFCRLKYKLLPAALPAADDLPALAAYYKRFYNTPLGAGTEAQFILNWRQFITSDTFL